MQGNSYSSNGEGHAAPSYDRPRYVGVVVNWNPERGFGFIRPEPPRASVKKDVFVHMSSTKGIKMTEGLRLSFEIGIDLRTHREQAKEVRLEV